MGTGEYIYDNYVKPSLSDFMGSIFEEICRQYLYRPDIYQSLPFMFGKLGICWAQTQKKAGGREKEYASEICYSC
ncbi:MAG: DUF234 domain-containing protein [Lachnospiraceae bacterium]